MTTVYHLTAGGDHYYLVRSPGYGVALLGDGQPLAEFRSVNYQNKWYVSSVPVKAFAHQHPDTTTTTGYQLRTPDAASPRYPMTLTPTDYDERTDDGDDDDAPEATLYTRITTVTPGITEPIDTTIIDLDGEPAPADGRTWYARLPAELTHHTELLHLFPGRLAGFAHAVATAVDRRLGSAHKYPGPRNVNADRGGCEVDKEGRIVAWCHVQYSPRQTSFIHHIGAGGRRLKTGANYPKTETITITVDVRDRVAGDTRAEAAAKWDRELTAVVDEIVETLQPLVCWHCHGKGFVRATDVPDTEPRRPFVPGSLRDLVEWIVDTEGLTVGTITAAARGALGVE